MATSSAPRKPCTPTRARYDRVSGVFRIETPVVVGDDGESGYTEAYSCVGYAGAPGHVNAPGSSHLVGLGPLPCGAYYVGLPHEHPRLGPLVFRLRPVAGNMMFGRSGFYIHGDNSKGNRSASNGCIVLQRRHREAISHYNVRELLVT